MALADRAAAHSLYGWVFFDRGLIDAAAALQHLTGEPALATLGQANRYHRRVFLTPPWPEIYRTDPERRHGLDRALGSNPHILLTLIAAEVGLDPEKDIRWVTDPKVKPMDRFIDGKIDAFLGFPPEPQQLRAAHVGHVLVNTAIDRPWSQYFCCMLAGFPDYVRAYPNATRSVLCAFLRAADLCATDPAGTARRLAAGGRVSRADYAAQTLADNNYKWREFDPEDTIRWYALRLRETGLIKSTPQHIIANGTDWRFLNELKRELKA